MDALERRRRREEEEEEAQRRSRSSNSNSFCAGSNDCGGSNCDGDGAIAVFLIAAIAIYVYFVSLNTKKEFKFRILFAHLPCFFIFIAFLFLTFGSITYIPSSDVGGNISKVEPQSASFVRVQVNNTSYHVQKIDFNDEGVKLQLEIPKPIVPVDYVKSDFFERTVDVVTMTPSPFIPSYVTYTLMAACMACSLIAWLLMRTDTPYTFIPLTVAIIVCLVLAGMGLVFSSMKWSLSDAIERDCAAISDVSVIPKTEIVHYNTLCNYFDDFKLSVAGGANTLNASIIMIISIAGMLFSGTALGMALYDQKTRYSDHRPLTTSEYDSFPKNSFTIASASPSAPPLASSDTDDLPSYSEVTSYQKL